MSLFADICSLIVVFLVVYIFAGFILLLGQLCFIFCCEVAAILGSHTILSLLDAGLLSVKFAGLLGCQLTTLDPLVDPVLLVNLPLLNARIVICSENRCDCK